MRVEASAHLTTDPASASVARRFVRRVLVEHGEDELVETATLLVSELVGNVVLHARTESDVRVCLEADHVRIEVEDRAGQGPVVRRYEPQAVTGRGLLLIEELSRAWGVDQLDGSKVVWFELARHSGAPPGVDDLVPVEVLGMDLALLERSRRHQEEVERELSLLALQDPPPSDVPARLFALQRELNDAYGRFTAEQDARVEQALTSPEGTIDLRYRLPRSARADVDRLEAMLEEVDRFCREGELLTLETPPDVLALRRWFLDQVRSQLAGAPPVPWSEVTAP